MAARRPRHVSTSVPTGAQWRDGVRGRKWDFVVLIWELNNSCLAYSGTPKIARLSTVQRGNGYERRGYANVSLARNGRRTAGDDGDGGDDGPRGHTAIL